MSYNTVSGVTTAPTVSYVYDYDSTYGTTGDGMLLRVNVGTDYQERYTLDSYKRVTSSIRAIGSRTYTTSYGRNQVSQATQVTYPSSRVLNISHDSKGRLSGIAEPLPGPNGSAPSYLRSVTYSDIGQLTGDIVGGTQFSWGYTGGVTEQFGYDANRLQMTSQKAGTASPYTNRMDLTYSYSATSGQMGSGSTAGNAGQLMSISGTIGGSTESAAFTYDNLGRLVTSNQTSNGSSAQRRFAYDRWGNRTGMWDATSGGTQIQSITLQGSGGIPTNQIASVTEGSTVNYTYDAAGNVTNDGVHSYSYDSANRIVSVDGGSTASNAYDHQNRRYKKTIGSTVTHYVWQGSQVQAEHNGSTGAVLTDYVYSGSRMISKVASSSTQYFLSDRLSTRLVLDSSGNVSGRQGHLAFGEDFAESGAQEKHHFTSYERDSESGTDYAVYRGYSQTTGRFNRPDPLASSGKNVAPQTWNRYAYAGSDPINMRDPWGLFACPGCGGPDDVDPCGPFGATILFTPFGSGSMEFCVETLPVPETAQSIAGSSCSIAPSLAGSPIGRYPNVPRNPDVNPNVTPLGPFVARIQDRQLNWVRYWGYQFEVVVTKTNLPDSGWTYYQAIISSVVFTYIGPGGVITSRTLPTIVIDPDPIRPENHSRLASDDQFHAWIDGPGAGPDIPLLFKDEFGNSYQVVSFTQTFNVIVQATNGNVSCSNFFRLQLTLSNLDSANPTAVWSH